MAFLYSNENFPLPVVDELRKLGHDIVTIQETGKSGQSFPDEAVLEFAISNERAVLTLNRKHFKNLHKKNQNYAGIIICTYDPDFSGQAKRVHAAICNESKLSGKLIRVNRQQN